MYETQIAQAGGKLITLRRSIANPMRYLKDLRKVIGEEKYDIVHVHGNSATMVLEMIAARQAGCKVRIAHSHNTTCRHQKIHRLMDPLFQALCTGRLACGEEAGRWLHGKRSFTVVNNGIQTQVYRFDSVARQNARQELGISREQKLICHVGTFNGVKNQAFLVEILEQLVATGEDWMMVLIGVGQTREAVEALVREKQLEKRLRFIGITDRVQDYLSAADLTVMPSLYEGLPLTLIEAQTNGLRCVVSDTITREVDKTGNLTFLPLSSGAEHWAQVIAQLPLETDRMKRSEAAAAKIRDCGYDIHDEAAKLKTLYINVVKQRRGER